MSDLLDKFLILILVVTLPVGVFVSSKVQENADLNEAVLIEQEKMTKIDKTLEDLRAASAKEAIPVAPTIEPIEISIVTYNEDEEKIRIEGTAPGTNLNVMVQAVVTKIAKPTPLPVKIIKAASGSGNVAEKVEDKSVLGESVDVVAVRTDNDGNFVLVREIDYDSTALLELRFDQAESTATIQYDFIANRRIF